MQADNSDKPSRKTLLSVSDVGKTYRIYGKPQDRLKQALSCGRRQYYREFQALRGVSFELRQGEFLGVVGRNGSGKSTLLQLVAGTLKPSTGEVRVRGRVAALLELGSGFNPDFTGRMNIYLNGAILGLTQAQIDERFDEIAAFADIGSFLDQPVKVYSTGMVVRLAFAVQVILDPEILIVDEALAVGDAAFQHRCYRRLDELRSKGVGLLFVSHGLELVRSICDRAIYLEHGQVKAQGEAASVCDLYFQDLLEEQVSEVEPVAAGDPDGAGEAAGEPAEREAVVLDRYVKGGTGKVTVQGSMEIEVARAELQLADPRRKALLEGDWLKIVAQLRVHNPAHRHILFGIMIRDRLGAEMFGFSARDRELGLADGVEPNGLIHVEARIKLDLRADTYFVTLGIQTPGFSDVIFYGHDMLSFTLEAPPMRDPLSVGGLSRLAYEINATPHQPKPLEIAL